MENSRKPPTDREQICTRKIQDAEKEIALIQFEFDAVLDEAQDILGRLYAIYKKLEEGPNLQEKQKLRKEQEILRSDPLYAKYFATSIRLSNAEQERDSYMHCLKMLKILEAPAAAPLPETSALETAALLVGDGSAEGGSPSSCVSDSTPVRGLDSWLRGLFNFHIKQD